jgi:hypothetical protein
MGLSGLCENQHAQPRSLIAHFPSPAGMTIYLEMGVIASEISKAKRNDAGSQIKFWNSGQIASRWDAGIDQNA